MNQPITTDYDRKTIRTLLANLMGENNRLFEMGSATIGPEHIPSDMPREKLLLDLIYRYAQLPTREVLLGHMLHQTKENQHEDIKKWFEQIVPTADRAVAPLCYPLLYRLDQIKLQEGLQHAQKRVESGEEMTIVYRDVVDAIADARPTGADSTKRMTQTERFEFYLAQQAKRAANKERYSKGLTWFTPSLNYLVPVVRYSDLILFTAQTKFGKSTVSSVMAEDIAWRQGYDVLFLQIETDHESFQERQIARLLNIPIKYQRMPFVNAKNAAPKAYRQDGTPTSFAQLYAEMEKYLKDTAEQRGEIIYVHCPQWGISDIRNRVDLERRLSTKRGRRLVVILDYLSAMPLPIGKGKYERDALNELINDIKAIPESYAESEWPIHFILLDQERNAEDETVSTEPEEIMKKMKSVRSKGTAAGATRAQVQISLQRPVASTSEMVFATKFYPIGEEIPLKMKNEMMEGEPRPVVNEDAEIIGYNVKYRTVNALGMDRYYHRIGQPSGFCWLFVPRANDGQPGWVCISIENELFKITETPDQDCPAIIAAKKEELMLRENFGEI